MMANELLLETDQTDCFDESGKAINCHNSGQDGAVKLTRRNKSSDRFCVMGDIVQDKLTGLFWHINANLPEFPLTWKEAFEFIQEMNTSRLSGINEWRLPARKELFSLMSHQFVNPSLPKGHPFNNVYPVYYWTHTESARLLDQAWYVHLGGGKVYRGMKHGSYMVWPVSGQFVDPPFMKNIDFQKNNFAALSVGDGRKRPIPSLLPCEMNFLKVYRFIPYGDSVYDRATCRYWYAGNKLNDGATTWTDAIRAVEKLNEMREAGRGSWRLPNIRELESLVDDRNHSPAFADGFLMNNVQEGYWSSTTSVYEPRYAWVLYARDGAIGVGFKPNVDFYGLAVRG